MFPCSSANLRGASKQRNIRNMQDSGPSRPRIGHPWSKQSDNSRLAANLSPVSDALVVGFVLQQSVQLFADLFSAQDFFLDIFRLHLLCGELDFLKIKKRHTQKHTEVLRGKFTTCCSLFSLNSRGFTRLETTEQSWNTVFLFKWIQKSVSASLKLPDQWQICSRLHLLARNRSNLAQLPSTKSRPSYESDEGNKLDLVLNGENLQHNKLLNFVLSVF